MEIEYGDPDLRCMAEDQAFVRAHWDRETVVSYRKKLQSIRSAVDERDLRGTRSLRLQQLPGTENHAWSIYLNNHLRLVLTLRESCHGQVVANLQLTDHDRRETSR